VACKFPYSGEACCELLYCELHYFINSTMKRSPVVVPEDMYSNRSSVSQEILCSCCQTHVCLAAPVQTMCRTTTPRFSPISATSESESDAGIPNTANSTSYPEACGDSKPPKWLKIQLRNFPTSYNSNTDISGDFPIHILKCII